MLRVVERERGDGRSYRIRPHRRKYGYHFLYEDDFVFRYDRDPTQHPEMPEHKHLPGDHVDPCDPVTLAQVVDEVLDVVAQREANE